MLKGIPKILSPELMKVMMEMGHGDTLVLADGNFPSGDLGKRVIRCDGHGIPELLEAILAFFPLDPYVTAPVSLMQVMKGDNVKTPIWDTYKQIIAKAEPNADIQEVERFTFYETSKTAYAIVQTGEGALYANVILQKGVVV